MLSPNRVTAASRLVAVLICAPFGASMLATVLPSAAVDALGLRAVAAPLPGTAGGLYFVYLGWLLGIVLAVRAVVTEHAADAVLAAFSLPCLIGAPVVVYRTFFTAPPEHVVQFPVLIPAASVLLAGFVILDGALDLRRSVRRRRSKTSA